LQMIGFQKLQPRKRRTGEFFTGSSFAFISAERRVC